MYGSQLITQEEVAELATYGMRFITPQDPEAHLYFWYQNPSALLVSSMGLVGSLYPFTRIDRLQINAIHELVEEFSLDVSKSIGYGSMSTTVMNAFREFNRYLRDRAYDSSVIGPMFGIYNSLGSNGRAGRPLKPCLAAARALTGLDVDPSLFYGFLDGLTGPKRLERTAQVYRQILVEYPDAHPHSAAGSFHRCVR